MWQQAQFLKVHILGHFEDCESYVYFGAIGFINFHAPVATFVANVFLTLDTAAIDQSRLTSDEFRIRQKIIRNSNFKIKVEYEA